MSSKSIDKKSFLFTQNPKNDIDYLKCLSKIVIPFSEFFSKKRVSDFYSGNKNNIYEEMDDERKFILIKEFL